MKDKILKHYWFSNSTDAALKSCKKMSKFRTEREYLENLILEEFERQQRGLTGPESTQIVDRLDYIKALLIPILEHIFITRQLSFFTAKATITLPGEVEKMSENEAGKFFKKAMEEALKNLKKEVGY